MSSSSSTPADASPFDTSGIETAADGSRRYTGLAPSLVHMLQASVRANPDGEAVAEVGGERLSYTELWERSARVAGGLRAAGVQRGDRVAIRLGNGVDWVLAFLGTQLAGAVAVPVNSRFAEPEVAYVLEDSGASYVVQAGSPLPDAEPLVVDDLGPDDLAGIFYTSGTTGFPKGAMTSHRNFLSNVETVIRVAGFRDVEPDADGLSTLVSVPLFHVTGCNSQLLILLSLAGRTVIMPTFDVKTFLRLIAEERITHVTTVPAIYWLALHQPEFADVDTTGVRGVLYGGAPIAPDLVHQIQKGFPAARLGNGYGLTETSSVATYLPHEEAAEHADSVGFPAPVVDVAVEAPDPETGVGELLIRGPNVVSGYWRKPQQTAEAFVDGWLHTGDLARIDAEGLVYIVDRMKDMINRGGENVYCVEVENALNLHPGVGEVSVLGVPDSMMGEKVGAVIVPMPGAGIDPAEVREFARAHLADFKVPQYIVVRSEPLPRNPGGKVLKPVLRDGTDWGPPLR